jgi:signal transducing adaptor molecule
MDFSSSDEVTKKKVASVPTNPNVVSSQQEEDDIAKAIQLSLQENKSGVKGASVASSSSTLYPSNSLYGGLGAAGASVAAGAGNSSSAGTSSSSSPKKEEKKARALYDFEAAEDNEMTFKAGEIVIIIDDSDANWWKGSNHRGEGLFPANFVDKNLNAEPEQFKEQRRRSVQFNEEVEVVSTAPILVEDLSTAEISEEKIDNVLQLLHEADPTQPESDAPELPAQEDQVYRMGPLIDAELEAVDRRHAQLTRLSTELVDALNLYHQLMHENIQGGYGMPLPNGGYNPYVGPASLPHQQQPPQFNGGYYPQPPVSGAPGMVPPGTYPTTAAPQPQLPPQASGGDNNQIYAGSAPPPPTPPLPHHDPAKQGVPMGVPPLQQPQSHFTPQQAAMAAEWINGQGGFPPQPHHGPPVVSGYQNPPMPQM